MSAWNEELKKAVDRIEKIIGVVDAIESMASRLSTANVAHLRGAIIGSARTMRPHLRGQANTLRAIAELQPTVEADHIESLARALYVNEGGNCALWNEQSLAFKKMMHQKAESILAILAENGVGIRMPFIKICNRDDRCGETPCVCGS